MEAVNEMLLILLQHPSKVKITIILKKYLRSFLENVKISFIIDLLGYFKIYVNDHSTMELSISCLYLPLSTVATQLGAHPDQNSC